MQKYTVKKTKKGKKLLIKESQNECEVTNLYRKCKNPKTKKISCLGIQIKKKRIFLKIQNSLLILRLTISPLKNVFF